MDYPLIVSHLNKRFCPRRIPSIKHFFLLLDKKKTVIACDDIDFKLQRGEILGIAGPNGSGKTTLIRILAGSVLPDSGTATINGFDIVKKDLKTKATLGVVFAENKNFYIRITGRENLRIFSSFYNLSDEAAQKKIQKIVDLLEIGEYLDRMFQEYSSGIKQRFALARGLLNDSSVLLFDEPTKNLDPSIAHRVKDFIRNELIKKEGKVAVWTSHVLSEIAEVADRIAILQKGRFKALGTLNELKKDSHQKDGHLEDIYSFYLTHTRRID